MELQEKALRVIRLIETVVQEVILKDIPVRNWSLPRGGGPILYIGDGITKLPTLYGIAEIDDERIVDYIVYQLYRSRQSIFNWKYTWLFSEAALSRFKQQFLSEDGKSGVNYYINQWLGEADLSRSDLVKIIADPKPNPLTNLIYLESEEPIKKRFYNTKEGLALCQQSTTGWSPLSEACENCKNWIECGTITAKKYPELMRLRKIAYGRKKK